MRLHLITVGTRMPEWVNIAYGEFASRMSQECRLHLIEVAAGKRSKGSKIEQLKQEEGERLLAAVPKDCMVIALDVNGEPWSTEVLAGRMKNWMQSGRDLALLVGGPDGLAENCLARADARWSLSALTFPHMLVRIIVAEQLYRAWTVLKGHPYHRS